MRVPNQLRTVITALAVTASASTATAAEICSNGIDDDSDGYVDEGCGFANAVSCAPTS